MFGSDIIWILILNCRKAIILKEKGKPYLQWLISNIIIISILIILLVIFNLSWEDSIRDVIYSKIICGSFILATIFDYRLNKDFYK